MTTPTTTATVSLTDDLTSAAAAALRDNDIAQAITRDSFLGIELWQGATIFSLMLAFLVILLAMVVCRVIYYFLAERLAAFARKSKTDLDEQLLEAARTPLSWVALILGFMFARPFLSLPTGPDAAINIDKLYGNVVSVALIVCVAWLAMRATYAIEAFLRRLAGRTKTKLDDQLIPIVRQSLNVIFFIIAAVMVIQKLGYNVGALLTGLGLGGLAFALAAQDSLKNLFGSFVVLTDQPFEVGDWIVLGETEGIVEQVGLRSTKVRTFANTLISLPNSKITDATVENMSRRWKRRIYATVGVTYETTADEMEAALEGVRTILAEHEAIDQDLVLVNFTEFNSSSLDIMVYCFTKSTVWAEWLAARQEVYLSIMRLLTSLGLSVAFPTRSLYIENGPLSQMTTPSESSAPTPQEGPSPTTTKMENIAEALPPDATPTTSAESTPPEGDLEAWRALGARLGRKALQTTLNAKDDDKPEGP